MKKPSKKSSELRKDLKEYPEIFEISDKQQAENFQRPLSWLNRILDALIEIVRDHIANGSRWTLGEVQLIDLLKRYKKRAIREGFADYYPEMDHRFIVWYEHFWTLNRELEKAKSLVGEANRCKESLGKAKEVKLKMVGMFPEFLGLPFDVWYYNLYLTDKALDRLDEAVRARRLTRFQLIDLLRQLRIEFRLLNMTVGDSLAAGGGQEAQGMRVAVEIAIGRIEALLQAVRRGDVEPGNPAGIRRIRGVLRRVRLNKYNAIQELGFYAGVAVSEWYKELFDMDYYIDNAADSWVDGHVIPWDPDRNRRTIEAAERAKIRFIHSFPDFLGMSLVWYYNNLYKMDAALKYARFLLILGDYEDVLEQLRKVRRSKHNIERHLRTV